MVGHLHVVIEIFQITLISVLWVRELLHATITAFCPSLAIVVHPHLLAAGALHPKTVAGHRYRARFLEADTHLNTTERDSTNHSLYLELPEIGEGHSSLGKKEHAILVDENKNLRSRHLAQTASRSICRHEVTFAEPMVASTP